tara:strand:- start:37 stop:294 length:258 start_codon:yes stop_codon:yes gene_type:complete
MDIKKQVTWHVNHVKKASLAMAQVRATSAWKGRIQTRQGRPTLLHAYSVQMGPRRIGPTHLKLHVMSARLENIPFANNYSQKMNG